MTQESEPRWLNDSERQAWMRLVGLTIVLPNAIESQLKRDAGLSFFEYHVLAMLSDAENHTRLLSDLALWTNSSLSRLSHVVTRLEKQGWVRREQCTDDRRATNAVLTEAGFEHLKQHAPTHVEEVRNLVFDQLTEEEALTLGRIIAKITGSRTSKLSSVPVN